MDDQPLEPGTLVWMRGGAKLVMYRVVRNRGAFGSPDRYFCDVEPFPNPYCDEAFMFPVDGLEPIPNPTPV